MELDPGVDYLRDETKKIKEIKGMMKTIIAAPEEPGPNKLTEFPHPLNSDGSFEKTFDNMYEKLLKEEVDITEKFSIDQVYDNYTNELLKHENMPN